jgi:signal recognition particle receptor subunit beta
VGILCCITEFPLFLQIFVVDSADRRRFEEASEELHRLMLEHDLAGRPLLIFANKQDLICAQTGEEVCIFCDVLDSQVSDR